MKKNIKNIVLITIIIVFFINCYENTSLSEPDEASINEYISRVKKQIEKGNLDDAEKNLNKAILTNPSLYDLNLLQGNIATMKGKYAKANNYYSLLITINQQKKAEKNNVNIYYKMAENYKYMADFDEAMNCYKEALKINKQNVNIKGIAESQLNIGQLQYYKSNYNESYRLFNRARKIYKEIGDKQGLILSYNFLSLSSMKLEQSDRAINYLKLATNELKDFNDEWSIAFTNKNAGYIYILNKSLTDVQSYLNQAVEGFKSVKDWKQLAETKSYQAIYYREQRKFDEAIELLNEALELSTNLKYVADQASYLNAKGLIYFHKNDFKKALIHFKKSLKIRQKIRDEANQAVLFFSIASTFDRLDQLPDAITYLHRAIEIEKRLNLPDYENDLAYLKQLQHKLKNPEPYRRKDYDKILGIETEDENSISADESKELIKENNNIEEAIIQPTSREQIRTSETIPTIKDKNKQKTIKQNNNDKKPKKSSINLIETKSLSNVGMKTPRMPQGKLKKK